MGLRYVWSKSTAIQNQGQRQRYMLASEDTGSITVDPGGTYISISSGAYCDPVTGALSLSGSIKTYNIYDLPTSQSSGIYGHVSTVNGIYNGTWYVWFGNVKTNSATLFTAEPYIDIYTYYTKGSFLSYVSDSSSGGYPSDGYSSGYYYVKVGSDNVDPAAVTVPDDIDDGTTIQITVTPSTEKVYGGTISYTYQYRYNGGSWQTLTTTTALTASLLVPKDQYSTLEARVRAQDDLGFVSTTWVSSGVKNIIANQPPAAPGITVDNVYINQHLTVTLTPAADPDGTVTSYIIQRRVDGGQWNQVQSGTSLTYTEVVDPDWGTIAYRAAAVDNEGLQGPWATSQTFDVNPGWVIISGPDSDLGSRPGPFVLEFEVEVVGSPDQDSIVTKVMLDDRDLIADLLLHDEDIVRIYFNTKYFAAGTHTIQVTASKEDYTPAMSVFNVYVPALSVDPLVGARVEVPQNSQGQPVAWLGLARCILGDDGRDVIQMCGDGLKLVQEEYTGTGTSGSSDPTALTLPFVPSAVLVVSETGDLPEMFWTGQSGGSSGVTFSLSGNTLSWYASNPSAQFNAEGTNYRYVAIGL